MDAQLAAIYGTGQANAEDDLEKVAAAELLVKLAAENNIDLNALSDEQVGELIQEFYKSAEDTHESSKESAESKEAEEKVAEADFLGRVMAHSMVQELGAIEKSAARMPTRGPAAQRLAEKMGLTKSTVGEKVKSFFRNRPKHYSEAKSELGAAFAKHDPKAARQAALKSGLRGKDLESAAASSKPGAMDRLRHLGRAARHVAPELGAAGGATALGVGVHKLTKSDSEKTGAALDDLAIERAYELAKEAGWVSEDGSMLPPNIKEASAEAVVEHRALELLEANGYPVQWSE